MEMRVQPGWIQGRLGRRANSPIIPVTGTRIGKVDFQDADVGDADLAILRGLANLKWLSLQGTQVTDAGMLHLKELSNLEGLSLHGTEVTDAGIVHLQSLSALKHLYLKGTQVTSSTVSLIDTS